LGLIKIITKFYFFLKKNSWKTLVIPKLSFMCTVGAFYALL
jgi:hypothetical protein